MAILSRNFCNADKIPDIDDIKDIFIAGIQEVRKKEKEIALFSSIEFDLNRIELIRRVDVIVKKKKNTRK